MDPIPSLSSPERMRIRMQFLLRIPFALIKLDQAIKHAIFDKKMMQVPHQ